MRNAKVTKDVHVAEWIGEMTDFSWSEVETKEKPNTKTRRLANGRGFEPPACSLGGCRHIQTRPPVR